MYDSLTESLAAYERIEEANDRAARDYEHASERLVDDLAGAITDGRPLNLPSLWAGDSAGELVEELIWNQPHKTGVEDLQALLRVVWLAADGAFDAAHDAALTIRRRIEALHVHANADKAAGEHLRGLCDAAAGDKAEEIAAEARHG